MANKSPQLYVLDANELNALGAMVEVMPLKQGMPLWNKLIKIAQENRIEDKLASYETWDSPPPQPVAEPESVPKGKKAKK